MKICLFADARSVHIQQLAPGLAALGHEVHVVTHKLTAVDGASVERFAVPEPSVGNLRRWGGRRAHYLRGFLRRFDIVNVHFLEDWGFDLDIGSARAAVVATAWGSDIVDPPGEVPASAGLVEARKKLLRGADGITTCGPTFAQKVAAFAGLGVEDVDVIPFGVNLERFRFGPHKELPRRVGFFKGFRAVYGPVVLMEAIPLILRGAPQARFELVGEGAELLRCQEMAPRLGVEKAITWYGRQAHDRLPGMLGRWDVTVIPSFHEAFGVAALESSAVGVPVVASDVCGLRDTVRHGETGLRVPAGDAQALAEAVLRLLGDDEERARMGRAGRETVEAEFDWRDLHLRWVRFYEEVRDQAVVMV